MKVKMSFCSKDYTEEQNQDSIWYPASLNWNYPVLPRQGEYIAASLSCKLVPEHDSGGLLWRVKSINWWDEKGKIVPHIYLVGE